MRVKPGLCFYMCSMYERVFDLYDTHMCAHTHTLPYKKYLCPTLLTLSASFPERHIKGHVHSRALCSLKCSRAATDPQILTLKPSAGRREGEQQRGNVERHMHRQMEGSCFCCTSGGCCQIYYRTAKLALAKYVFVSS